jgi:uncharacterized protein (TIGR02246 family)
LEPSHNEIADVYKRLLNAWNDRDAQGMADLFAEDGEMIGFDGSQAVGQADIFSHLKPVFDHHPTAAFVSIVKSVRLLGENTGLLRAIAGMVPPGATDINPKVNTHHTLIVVRGHGQWRIQLFQNTPAQFHGRPELVEQMSEELRSQLS